MKKKIIKMVLFSILFVMVLITGCGNTDSGQNQTEFDGKTLIVYYSYSGTTQRVAEHLQKITGGDLYELTLTEPYTGTSNDVSDRVFQERDDKKMPELSGKLPDIENYDRILIGTPVWNNSMSNPVAGYLQQTDFQGKQVALFWTYITNQGSTKKDFSRQVQNGIVEKGLTLRSAIDDDKLDHTLQNWVSNL